MKEVSKGRNEWKKERSGEGNGKRKGVREGKKRKGKGSLGREDGWE